MQCVLLCDLVTMNNNKLKVLQIFIKSVLNKSYYIRGFMAFKPNDQCYSHVHGSVCLNESILCKNVRFSMVHNAAQGSFQLYFTKNTFFNFRVLKRGLFVKHLPKMCNKMVRSHFCKIVDHMFSENHQLVASQNLSIHLL